MIDLQYEIARIDRAQAQLRAARGRDLPFYLVLTILGAGAAACFSGGVVVALMAGH